ncbi:MAG: pyridoxal-phosphate dependent enzyme, partial [Candidatus Aquilonibacter sp.]
MPISFTDVIEAAQRIRGVAHHTPTLTSQTFNELTDAQLFFKCENLQRMGAFKFRGAYNRLSQLTPEERRAGVVAYSSGNHAQGVALAAKLLDMPATIVMPRDAPESKLAATRGYGAEVVLYERSEENRAVIAQGIARERGATIVPPYDDERIAAGAGTTALELLHDAGPLDTLVAPLGGGGLL